MRAAQLAAALLTIKLAASLAANETGDLSISGHDGTYDMGIHMDVAIRVYNHIVENIDALNLWAPDVRLSAGKPFRVKDPITGEYKVAMVPFNYLELAANAGTAVNLLGCRDTEGNDLDFWIRGPMQVAGQDVLRIEINGAPPEDNVWLTSDHFRDGIAMHPGLPILGRSANQVMDSASRAPHVYTYSTQTREVDIWAPGYEADELLLKKLRTNFQRNKGQLINVKLDTEVAHRHIRIMNFPDLIIQKASLVITGSRQCKNDAVAWPKTSYKGGKRKLENDARDLYCLCHHRKYARRYVGSRTSYKYIRMICDIALVAAADAIRDMGDDAYNTLAHAALEAPGGAVGVHMCTGPDGPCVDGAAAPPEVQALAPIEAALEEF